MIFGTAFKGVAKVAKKKGTKKRPAVAGGSRGKNGTKVIGTRKTTKKVKYVRSDEQKLIDEFYGLKPSHRRAEIAKGRKSEYWEAIKAMERRGTDTSKGVLASTRRKIRS
jgi:hypothetical protein